MSRAVKPKILIPVLLILAALILVAMVPAWSRVGGGEAIVQPIMFNHALHAEEDMACLDCHARADKGPYATYPPVATCLLCHGEAQGEHPDEPKIREFAESLGAIPWKRINRMDGHVYFSHEAHVRFAEMECATCHGDVASLAEPAGQSQVEHLTMERCMSCHEVEGVTNDCLACHK